MRIAFIINTIEDDYQQNLWEGICNKAEELGVEAIAIPGGLINSTMHDNDVRNTLYSILSNGKWDGAIVCSAVYATFAKPSIIFEILEKVIGDISNFPIVNMGGKINVYPTIQIDNKRGLDKLVEHIIVKHGVRKIAHISGPLNNSEAIERKEIFQQVLRKHRIEIREEWIAEGTFERWSGRKAAEAIWSSPEKPEAIVAANDLMALGAYDFFIEKRINIPSDLILTGFDDIVDAKLNAVPISTVRQPIYAEGEKALEMLYQWIKTGNKPDDLIFPAEVIYRNSCGCLSELVHQAGHHMGATVSDEPSFNIENILAEIRKRHRMEINSKEKEIFKYFVDDILSFCQDSCKEENIDELAKKLSEKLTSFDDEYDLSRWFLFIGVLFDFVRRQKQEESALVLSLYSKLLIMIHEKISLKLGRAQMDMVNSSVKVQYFLQLIREAESMEEVFSILSRELGNFGVKNCLLFLFDAKDWETCFKEAKFPEKGRIAFVIKGGKAVDNISDYMESAKIIEYPFFDTVVGRAMAIYPMIVNSRYLGFICMDGNELFRGFFHNTFSSQLASTLISIRLLADMKISTSRLTSWSVEIKKTANSIFEVIGHLQDISRDRVADMVSMTDEINQRRSMFEKNLEINTSISENAMFMQDLLSLIDDISQRINLLAINASIEAARAGEHGKGFKVIAEEVRKLADNTAKRAQETNDVLNQVLKTIGQSQELSESLFSTYSDIAKEMEHFKEALETIESSLSEFSAQSKRLEELVEQ
ncbi:methyl-accepting chemotaxis protein [Spirochaetia bacterium 38H-sp]|uniref:Methyl-accepting chemotaxis protein n=1 Tax=Rarispira pelagica TaxID=3141764 RepID=A0ABU9U8G4_9SPIR